MASNNVSWRTNEGRNTWDAPDNVPDDMSVESLNVSLKAGTLGTKRKTIAELDFASNAITFLAGGIGALFRFTPGQDIYNTRLVIITDENPVRVIVSQAAPLVNVVMTQVDAITTTAGLGAPWNSSAAALNGKLFIACKTGVNRLHVIDYYSDPAIPPTALRRSGLKAPAVPTVADQGGGAYARTPRWYAVCNRVKNAAGTVVRQSNLSAGVAWTPGAGVLSARVTKAAATGESETHWVLWGSVVSINGPWYPIAETVVATTFFDDTLDPNIYSTLGNAAPPFGSHYPMPSLKFITTDGSRILGMGVWESAAGDSVLPQAGTVYISPVINASYGSGSGMDEERFQSTADQVDTLILNINADSVDVGISEVVNGVIYAFQGRGIWALTPTLNSQAPYSKHQIDKARGAVSHKSIVTGMDASGRPCTYFLNPADGPCRITVGNTIEWLGKDVADIWREVSRSLALNVGSSPVAHGAFDPISKEVKWWVIGTYGQTEPDTMIVFNVMLGRSEVRAQSVRYGWSKWTGGLLPTSRCSVAMEPFPDAAGLPFADHIHVGRKTSPWICRQDGRLSGDCGTSNFQAYVTSAVLWEFGALLYRKFKRAYLTALAATATIRQTVIRNFAQDAPTDDASLAAAGTETRVIRQFANDIAQCNVAQVQLGDSAASSQTWTLDRYDANTEPETGPNP